MAYSQRMGKLGVKCWAIHIKEILIVWLEVVEYVQREEAEIEREGLLEIQTPWRAQYQEYQEKTTQSMPLFSILGFLAMDR